MSNTVNGVADIVIVGGGIYGASLAYELAVAGKKVTLLEGAEIASGASGGPGERGVRANNRDLRELPIVAKAIDLWQDFQNRFEGGVGYRRLGGLQVYDLPYGQREHEVFGQMEARAAVQNAMGVPTEILSREATLDKEPELFKGVRHALYCPKDGVGDHTYATRQFAKEAAKAGALIRSKAFVTGIVHEGRSATGVKLDSGEIVQVGEQLVILSNAGALSLLKPIFGANEIMPVWNIHPQMMYVTNPHGKKVNHLLSHAHRRLAIKQIPDGTLMLSGGVSVRYTQPDLWHGSLSSTAINLTDSIATLPFLDDSSFVKVDASRTDTVALDGVPIIDRPHALGNTIYGFAWSGHGFAISLGFTHYFREWLLTGEKPAELDAFSPARFIN
ncbi:FAD-binding oxidoreductase [Caballeronia sp. LZ065]|uniref:NAD(P)/FAD-dependent oxidoreductase n=1 Tax=Caballeronia sp. LZ065 TaxID=3038571 RepID=UPI00285AA808|nr:FAD-binding oxidoreductase [Caballeronia sp. LZ065]MDR5780983.1 FAD-binding oxidoreductase [Caballeronia sp. LZ065]